MFQTLLFAVRFRIFTSIRPVKYTNISVCICVSLMYLSCYNKMYAVTFFFFIHCCFFDCLILWRFCSLLCIVCLLHANFIRRFQRSFTYLQTYEIINSKSQRWILYSPTFASAFPYIYLLPVYSFTLDIYRSLPFSTLPLILLFLHLIFISISFVYNASGLCRHRRLTLSIARQLYAPDARCLPHPVALLIAYILHIHTLV